MGNKRRVLAISSYFPWRGAPIFGVFVKERLRQIVADGYATIQVISPKPVCPRIPLNHRWQVYSDVPRMDTIEGIVVHYPRYIMLPKISAYIHPLLMYYPTCRLISTLCKDFRPDIIDAHFVYPSGVLAVWIARRLRLPVVITGRGEDMTVCPKNILLRRQIGSALKQATCLIAVSQEIHDLMVNYGADAEKVFTVPNGVDLGKFAPMAKEDARAQLGLPRCGRIALTVGYRIRRKGFDLFIDAIHKLYRRGYSIKGIIVGGPAPWEPDRGPELERKISALKLEDVVRLVGQRPHEELRLWLSAADVFVLLSTREGSPNVVMEALGCGTPVVATAVGEIPNLLAGVSFAKVLASRSPDEAADAILVMCEGAPDRWNIREFAQKFSWAMVAEKVDSVWQRAIELHRARRGQKFNSD